MDTTTLSPLRALAERLASLLITPAARAIAPMAWALLPAAQAMLPTTARAPWRTLAPGTALTLRAGRGTRLQVEAGRLWLTEPGDAGDHFVAAGDGRMLRGGTRTVIECDGTAAARFRLLPAAMVTAMARGHGLAPGAVPDRGAARDLAVMPGAAMR